MDNFYIYSDRGLPYLVNQIYNFQMNSKQQYIYGEMLYPQYFHNKS